MNKLLKKTKRKKLRKILGKYQPKFQHYVKKVEAQAKKTWYCQVRKREPPQPIDKVLLMQCNSNSADLQCPQCAQPHPPSFLLGGEVKPPTKYINKNSLFVVTKNSNWEILIKNLVTFKR